MKCLADNCYREKYAKGFCSKHYHRFQKHGDPNATNIVWTDEKIETEIMNISSALGIKRMPTSSELKTLGRNDLHCKISRTKKYSGWAEHLGLDRKQSETLMGQGYEDFITKELENQGHKVERMSTKHPYDLLINDTVKVDVKAGKSYIMRGSRVHSFGINKKDQTCDIYIVLAIDEKDAIERTFIIPSHFLKVVSLCIGRESKYNKFIDRWDYIKTYSAFFGKVV